MTQDLDVYRDWLGISEAERPLNYYQLFRLKPFEDDPAKVRSNYRKMNAHVRKYAAGEFASQSQELLNELAKAMLCLTDSVRKAEYDASLGRTGQGQGRGRSIEEILVGRKVLDSNQLDKARRYAKTVGVDIRDAVMQQKLAAPDLVMQAYAESEGLPYVDLADVGPDEKLIPQIPAVLARQHSCAPLLVDDGRLLVVSPNPLLPEVEEQLRLRFGMPVRSVLCTPASMNDVINKFYPRGAAAAQMAGGGPKPAAATAAATPAAAPAGQSAEAAPAKTLADPAVRAEFKKQQRMVALLAFNFGVMAWGVTASIMGYTLSWGITKLILVGLAVGAACGAIGWVVKELKRP